MLQQPAVAGRSRRRAGCTRLVALSAAFASDTAFSRQLKRKWAATVPPAAAGTAAGMAAASTAGPAAAGRLPSTDQLLSFYMEQQRSER